LRIAVADRGCGSRLRIAVADRGSRFGSWRLGTNKTTDRPGTTSTNIFARLYDDLYFFVVDSGLVVD